MATAVDISTGATVAADDNDAISANVPLSLTKDEDAYIGTSVAFKGMCAGAFADGASESAALRAAATAADAAATADVALSRCPHRR